MLKKIILLVLFFAGILNATNLNVNKNKYNPNEQIRVHFSGMVGKNQDWVAIYPENSNNQWANVKRWNWTNDKAAGDLLFQGLPVGKYEVRAFYNNSYNVEVSKKFTVNGNNVAATVTTNKVDYNLGEIVTASFNHMSGNNEDWIAIYKAGSDNTWANVIDWAYIDGKVQGSKSFKNLPKGNYEVRVFFNNSYHVEVTHAFTVGANIVTTVTTNKDHYTQGETVTAAFDNMTGNNRDWIAIYPAGTTNAWKNVVDWGWIDGKIKGNKSFINLPVGNYEVRVFFKNSFDLGATHAFEIVASQHEPMRVLYDDFEDGIDPRWTCILGHPMELLNYGVKNEAIASTDRKVKINGQHSLRTFNSDHFKPKTSSYIFDFQHPAQEFKFLEVDMSKGVSSHRFSFGVRVKTKFGNRMITFASYYNHQLESTGKQIIRGPYRNVLKGHKVPRTFNNNSIHVHPAPTDYYVATSNVGGGSNMFVYYKINIEEKLKVLEPDNELYEIEYFITSGGDYDNLALSNH